MQPFGSRIAVEPSRTKQIGDRFLHGHRHSEHTIRRRRDEPRAVHLVVGDARTYSSAVLSSPLDHSRAEPGSRSTR